MRTGDRRSARFALRDVLAAHSSVDRVRACGRRRVSRGADPEVRVREGRAHFSRVALCGSVWACPVCGPRIRSERARDLDVALRVWIERHGAGSVSLVTLTLPHDWGESLAALRATVRGSFNAITSGRPWTRLRDRFGLAHHVAALDVTHGRAAGWHPHLHVILLGTRRLDDGDVRALRRRLYVAWAGALREAGRRLPVYRSVGRDGRVFYGVDVERARSRRDVARYACQVIGETDDDRRPWGVAQEAVRTDLKRSGAAGHRSPWQILQDFADDGDADDLALWHEYEAAMKGATAVKLGRGLRAAVGLGAEKSDEDVVAVEVGGETVYTFRDAGEWLAVCDVRGGRARVLRAAERWGAAGCARMVAAVVRRWQRKRRRSARAPDAATAGASLVTAGA